MTPEQMAALAAPFPPEVIRTKGGSFAAKYVSHADVTERLNEVIPGWVYEPMARTPEGLPLFDEDGGLWIWLITPLGERMPGYGEPGTMDNRHDQKKTAVSDAIKNAAMRLGVALDLWKGDEPDRIPVPQDVKQATYPPRNPAKKRASRKASDSSIEFARSLIDTVDDGSAIAAKVLGSTPIDIADQAQVSAVIDTLKPLKEAAMKKVTRSKGQDDSEWVEVPF